MNSVFFNRYLPWLFAGIAIIGHFWIQKDLLFLPLMGDENYYALPVGLHQYLDWPSYSFGHPPFWHFINSAFYKILGNSSISARTTGLFFSVSFLIGIFLLGLHYRQLLLASVIMLIFPNFGYVRDFGSFNHPVIAASLIGFASVIFASEKKWKLFIISMSLALCIRESALVYLLASCFLVTKRTEWKYFAPPLSLLAAFYLWYFLAQDKLLVNDQVQILLLSGDSPFIFSLNNIKAHFLLIFRLFPLSAYLLLIVILPLLYVGQKFSWTSMSKALIAIFIVHSIFFGLYVDVGIRNTFMGAMALLFLIFHMSCEANPRNAWHKSLILVAAVFCCFSLFENVTEKSENFKNHQQEASLHRQMAQSLKNLGLPNENVVIRATNPYHSYMLSPFLGYTDIPIIIEWYGGTPGYMDLGEFQVGIVHQPLHQWPERDIYEYAKKNNFQLYEEIKGHNQTLQIWVDVKKLREK